MTDLLSISKSETRQLMVCFADLTLFTRISRQLSPVEVFKMLDNMFKTIEDHVTRAGGYIVKYMGDSALILFEQDDMESGIRALLDSKNEIDEWFQKTNRPNRLSVNCHFGDVTVGRFETNSGSWIDVIGDTVQYASMLGRYKKYGLTSDFIVSKDVFNNLGKKGKELFHRFTPPLVYRADY